MMDQAPGPDHHTRSGSRLRVTSSQERPQVARVEGGLPPGALSGAAIACALLVLGGVLASFLGAFTRLLPGAIPGAMASPGRLDAPGLAEQASAVQAEVLPLSISLAVLAVVAIPVHPRLRTWLVGAVPFALAWSDPSFEMGLSGPVVTLGLAPLARWFNDLAAPWILLVAPAIYVPLVLLALVGAAGRLPTTGRRATMQGVERFAVAMVVAVTVMWSQQQAPDAYLLAAPSFDQRSPSSSHDASSAEHFTVTGVEGLNVRAGPGMDHEVIHRLAPDDAPVPGSGETEQTETLLWRELVLPDGRTGWSSDRYLEPVER